MQQKQSFMREILSPTKELVGHPPPIVPFADWDYYYLVEDLRWYFTSHPGFDLPDFDITVPRGFVTNLASVPKIFWNILSPAARYSYPAIIHDYLYWYQPCTRLLADRVLKQSMKEVGVSSERLYIIYGAVRGWGFLAWNSNAVARAKGEHRILSKFPPEFTTSWQEWSRDPDVFTDQA